MEVVIDFGVWLWKVFWEVTLWFTLLGVVIGVLFVFILMLGEYIILNIFGGGNFEFVGNVIGDMF